tara:strand:- start:538 stop:1362 length:825 start_codon:yes stop_codon:yes gene_type:complete
MSCCKSLLIPSFCKEINTIISNLDLEEYQKTILNQRYVKIVNFYQQKASSNGRYDNIFRTTVTTGSLLLPALLSIQQMGDESTQTIVYWSTWCLSLCVTTANGFIQLFKIDKKYLSYSMVSEKLKSEGWSYFQLSGKYENTTHKESFTKFCEKIERIKMKQVTFDFTELNKKKKKVENKEGNKEKEELNNLNNKKEDIENNIENNVTDLMNNKISDMMNNKMSEIQNMFSNINNIANTSNIINNDNKKDDVKNNVKNDINNNVKKDVKKDVNNN